MTGITATRRSRSKQKELTLRGHLEELRWRLIYCAIAVVITSIVSFVFARRIFDFFQARAPDNVNFVFVETTEMIGTYMKVCLYSGLALALPFLIYQLVMFVKPALTRREKSYLYLLLPGVIFFFAGGAAFAYFVFLPPALEILLDFPLVSDVQAMIRIGNYISTIVRLLVAIGLLFELPLLMYFLARIGVVSHQRLARYRKYAFVCAFIVAAIVTPTGDPLNCTIVAMPTYLLYELGILFARLARRGAPAAAGG